MLTRLSLVSWKENAGEDSKAALRSGLERLSAIASPSASALIADDLPPNRNGGDIIWRLEFRSQEDHDALVNGDAWREAMREFETSAALGHVDLAIYETIAAGDRGPERTGGLYRLLLMAVDEKTGDSLRDQFEAEMAAMPNYVHTILRWNFGRVIEHGGSRQWTYLWEQEFADLSGFRGEYMQNAYHWGFLDRWYDSDNPIRIIDPHLCNSFTTIDAPVMFAKADRPIEGRA